MIDAISREIHLRKDFLPSTSLDSIYFGGGTPSLLNKTDLDKIFSTLSSIYSWDDHTEITLEANPDDLNQSNLQTFKDVGINRLSIGIQSFDPVDLQFMNRAHNTEEAEKSIKEAQDAGFENISADLIYGSPTTSDKTWLLNMDKMLSFGIPHISAYCLTVEQGTALHHFVKKGKTRGVDEEKATHQFEQLIAKLVDNGYDHYEISNFGKPNSYAVHNTNYWMGTPYLGLGPGAHSFDGQSTRSWNLAHNPKYISALQKGDLPIEHEELSEKEKFNEFVLIRLRTKWGIDLQTLNDSFPQYKDHFLSKIKGFVERKEVNHLDHAYVLTNHGKHLADRISMELFVD